MACDKVVNTIVALLIQHGFEAGAYAGVMEVEKATLESVRSTLLKLDLTELPTETELAQQVLEKRIEKFDEFLPESILSVGYGAKTFDRSLVVEFLKFLDNN